MTKFEINNNHLVIELLSRYYISYKSISHFKESRNEIECFLKNDSISLPNKQHTLLDITIYVNNENYTITPINLNRTYCRVNSWEELEEYKQKIEKLLNILKEKVLL